jgi:DNA-directed RNA polymerase
MWRSAAQQLARQKLEAVGRAKSLSNFPLFRHIITFQSTSNSPATNAQAVERPPEFERGPDLKSGLRFGTVSPNPLSPLDSAFLELVHLLPQCWRHSPSTDHNQEYRKPEPSLEVSDNQVYLSAIEAHELSDQEIDCSDDEALENGWLNVGDDTKSASQTAQEKKIQRKKQRELYKRQLKVETEAWQAAATAYKEMMTEMCRKSLAPNLPFAQSLLLGWFEPLR